MLPNDEIIQISCEPIWKIEHNSKDVLMQQNEVH